jgi:hypothetical protein
MWNWKPQKTNHYFFYRNYIRVTEVHNTVHIIGALDLGTRIALFVQSKNEWINSLSMQINRAEGEQSNQYNKSFLQRIVTSLAHLELGKEKN